MVGKMDSRSIREDWMGMLFAVSSQVTAQSMMKQKMEIDRYLCPPMSTLSKWEVK
jgi:hypothetical protein